jgi:hypothetical protein
MKKNIHNILSIFFLSSFIFCKFSQKIIKLTCSSSITYQLSFRIIYDFVFFFLTLTKYNYSYHPINTVLHSLIDD